jgi:hypothetical protein
MMVTRLAVAAVFVCATAFSETAPTSVTCKDGTASKGGRGACRGHGGVDKTKAAAVAPAPTPPPAAAKTTPSPAPATAPVATAATKVSHGGKAATDDPAGALAKCKDGMYWHGASHSGSCSHHGGVESWLDGTQKH